MYQYYLYFILLYLLPNEEMEMMARTGRYMEQRNLQPQCLACLTTLGGNYHRCHYWNNFEILDLHFFTSSTYLDYFDYLDQARGVELYRWGDALIRTIAVHFFIPDDKIIRIDDIAYKHMHACRNYCGNDTVVCKWDCPRGICKKCTVSERQFRDMQPVVWLVWAILGACVVGIVALIILLRSIQILFTLDVGRSEQTTAVARDHHATSVAPFGVDNFGDNLIEVASPTVKKAL